jgi:serine protease Do
VVIALVAVGAAGAVFLSSSVFGTQGRPTRALTVAASENPPTATPSALASVVPASFAELYRQAGDGVIRIETTACDGGGVGSGFLLAPALVATVAHVVRGAFSVVLRQGTSTATGTVVGYDLSHEVALVRSSVPLSGHVFTMADSQPAVGTEVAAIGYPLAAPESLSKGTVSGLDRPITTESGSLTGLIQTDTPINPGNSGGPLLTADGTVVGLVEAKNTAASGIGYAVPTTHAKSLLEGWQAAPVPVHTARTCGSPTGPQGVEAVITDDSGSPDGPPIASSFSTYATGINTGNYDSAYAILSPRSQRLTSAQTFANGEASSYVVELSVGSVTPGTAGADTVDVTFTSVQDPVLGGTGQGCSTWHISYTMVKAGSGWQIDRAKPVSGSPAPC